MQLNGYQKSAALNTYKNTSVITASPEKIVLLLFDGAIKFINSAKAALKQNKFSDFGEQVNKAQRIFSELRKNLNFHEGKDIAQNLDRLYAYIDMQLSRANIKKDEQLLDDVIKIILPLRAGWEQIVPA